MKNSLLLKALIIIIGLTTNLSSQAQCDTVATLCDNHIKNGFVSDGQNYRSLLVGEEIAEFDLTLYGESTYRFAACSGLADGNLIFSVYDKERNLLFTNKEYSNSPYWDFKITNTINCTIEATLNQETVGSGCAVLLVGFKQ